MDRWRLAKFSFEGQGCFWRVCLLPKSAVNAFDFAVALRVVRRGEYSTLSLVLFFREAAAVPDLEPGGGAGLYWWLFAVHGG
jgi:hypothetical protein